MMEELQEKSLQHESVKISIPDARTPFGDLDETVKLAIRSAQEKKAVDLVVLDLREIASFTEFFIIASGTNQRQVQAVCDEIDAQLKKQLRAKAVRIEGYNTGEWVLLDYGDFVVHVFNKEAREFYDLERLWRDARKVDLPAEGA